ncbi:MAG: hypothetical protein JRJ80_06890 [Deltaproteobacteria bacterium]|nr:hypothetical protein [Deltaproteobacteria bacterium]
MTLALTLTPALTLTLALLLAGGRDGLGLVLTGQDLIVRQRLEVAGAKTGHDVRDRSQAIDPNHVDLLNASIDTLVALDLGAELGKAHVRPTTDLVAELAGGTRGTQPIRIAAAREQQQSHPHRSK